MKKILFLAILAAVLILSGCTRSGGTWRISPRASLTPPVLTVVVTNNTLYPISFYENGQPIMGRDPTTGEWKTLFLLPGNTVSRGYYSFLGSREIVLTARATCPAGEPIPAERPNTGCVAGDYVGVTTRSFYVYSGSDYRVDNWVIDHIQAVRSRAY